MNLCHVVRWQTPVVPGNFSTFEGCCVQEEAWIVGKPDLDVAPRQCAGSRVAPHPVIWQNIRHPYVYWTVNHLDSWVKRDNLMSLALLFLYLMLNMFRMLIHPSSGACDLFVELFHGLYWSGSMCIGVTLWFGCGGVVSICRLRH